MPLTPRLFPVFILVLMNGVFAIPSSDRVLEDLPKREAMQMAQKDLDSITTELKRNPSNSEAKWMKLRLLHALSVSKEDLIQEGLGLADGMSKSFNDSQFIKNSPEPNSRPSAVESQALLQAYRGAFQVVIAKHDFWPTQKMEALKKGLPDLDSSVAKFPDQMEIRYLRLVSCYYLPFFLGRKWSVKEDFQALSEGLVAYQGKIPDRWFLGITHFVLNHADKDQVNHPRLSEIYWKVFDQTYATN